MLQEIMITEDTKIPKTIKQREYGDIRVIKVRVPVGGNFTLSLFDLAGYEKKEQLTQIDNPLSGETFEIGRTIAHDLAYTLKYPEDKRFQVVVVYEEVPPKMTPSGPL